VSSGLITPVVNRWIEDGLRDPEGFWERAARELPWFRGWDRVFEWTPPTFRWFIGAETNLAYNALDHHVAHGRGGQAALIYLNERGERAVHTYAQVLFEVKRLAASLRAFGIRKGDRITIYMPTSAEAIMLMLATVRIGAIHSVVFAGFGASALGDRIAASGSRLVFTADVTYRKGKAVRLKEIVDEAMKVGGATVEHVIVWEREGRPEGLHYDYRDLRLPQCVEDDRQSIDLKATGRRDEPLPDKLPGHPRGRRPRGRVNGVHPPTRPNGCLVSGDLKKN
jgi:acetyl-CoA synthetase